MRVEDGELKWVLKSHRGVFLLTELDLSILCEQHVLALDVSVDDFVGMKVREALLACER